VILFKVQPRSAQTAARALSSRGWMRFVHAFGRWFDCTILGLAREMRLSYLPPLMVYTAAGVSGLTGIVGVFFVKDYLGLSAAFLASLGFWAGIPWALKMPLGHLVDLIWKYKSAIVYLGAMLLAASLLIMVGLLADPEAMRGVMPIEAWYVLSALLAPIGFVLQDVVADAMTVEAVPRVDESGHAIDPDQRKLMNTTVQTLGRVAIIGGGVLVALINVYLFRGVEELAEPQKARIYQQVYAAALIVPLLSVSGVLLASFLRRQQRRRIQQRGLSDDTLSDARTSRVAPNWWILGGSLVFAAFSVGVGVVGMPFAQELIFIGSLAIVAFLMRKLLAALEPASRRTLVGTAIIIFAYRAAPTPGPGVTWWMIDELHFDQQFLSVLALFASGITLAGLFAFRRYVAEHSIARVVLVLTVFGAILGLPLLGMYYGLHDWTAAVTGGIVDARFIALIDTALESPLMQIAMIPMLAWIANSAPMGMKATYFAVMASFTNLALALGQLGTKYLNQIFIVTRQVIDPATGATTVAADYGELGWLMITSGVVAFALPILAILATHRLRLRTA
jgi:BT1 family